MSELHTDAYEGHGEQVTATELQLLREHEPGIDFRVVDAATLGLSEGRQSRVSVLEYERGGETHRVLWKRMGAGKGLTPGESTGFNDELRPYRAELIAAGWNIPQLLYTRISALRNEHQIFAYEQFISGGDGEKMLADPTQPNFRKWYMVGEVVRTLCHYPPSSLVRAAIAGRTVTRLPHGLDLKLANVVLEQSTNRLYFVDLFGPKRLDDQGHWRSYSTKLDTLKPVGLKAVCATREGTILRCWRLAERYWSHGYRSPDQLRTEFIGQISQLPLPYEELRFVREEIEAGYPWLDGIYEEREV